MSKKSRRRNRALGVIAGLMGAKALGFLGSKSAATSGASKVVGKTPEFRKSFVSPKIKTPVEKTKNLMPDVSKTKKSFPLKTSKKVPISSGPFKMFGVKEMPSKESISKFKAAEEARIARVKSKSASLKKLQEKFSNKDFGLGAMDGAKKGKMIRARGGGMAKTKPTKMY